jgi:DNA polymerase III epsilon subunit-like protein
VKSEEHQLTPPADFKLGTLAQFLGVSLAEEDAHDALADVRACLHIYRAMTVRTASVARQAA